MKNLLSLLLISASTSLVALPVMNPSHPCLLKKGEYSLALDKLITDTVRYEQVLTGFSVGYISDTINMRHLSSDSWNMKTSSFESQSHLANFGLNIGNKAEIFVRVGTTDHNFSLAHELVDMAFKTHSDLAFGFGLNAVIYDFGTYVVGTNLNSHFTNSSVASVVTQGQKSNAIYTNDIRSYEYQGAVSISRRSGILHPYVAVKASFHETNFHNKDLPKLTNDNIFGLALGCTLVGDERVSLTVEGRLFDERAITINSQIRF